MENFVADYFGRLADPFFNPQKRVFVLYLATALAIAMVVQWRVAGGGAAAFRDVFSKKIWLSASAWLDYKIILLNQAIMMGVMPRLVTKLAVATFLFEMFHIWFDGRAVLWSDAPGWAIVGFFTATLFLLDDFTKYLLHRALHRWPVLWCFHELHHTAETLTPLTVYRTHPVEGVLFALRSIFAQGVTLAVFVYLFGNRVELAAILGANAILFFFNVAGANLRHSHIWLSYGRALERILISPAQHQIHHSLDKTHHDRNFGAILAVWDWVGGSLCLADGNKPSKFGVRQHAASKHTLFSAYVDPFGELWRQATRLIEMMKNPGFRRLKLRLGFGAAVSIVFCGILFSSGAFANELNIYSHRQPFLINPFIDAYTKATGTKVNIVYASKGLAQRLQAEGARSPADIVLTVDIARLSVYADKDLLAPVDSEILRTNVPQHLRDPKNRWFAFSKRARVLVVSKKAEDAMTIKRYEDLADPRWRGRICTRPGSHVYNRALVASLIDALGLEQAEKWANGVIANLARRPQGNDRAQVKAIYEGVCDIGIINNYYFGKLEHSDKPEQRDWAAAVSMIFPNQADRGTHVNISGGGVAVHSKHKAEAVRFLEFLTQKEAQELYGRINFEYPVNPAVKPSMELQAWGAFREDDMPISRIAELAPQAQKVIDRVGW